MARSFAEERARRAKSPEDSDPADADFAEGFEQGFDDAMSLVESGQLYSEKWRELDRVLLDFGGFGRLLDGEWDGDDKSSLIGSLAFDSDGIFREIEGVEIQRRFIVVREGLIVVPEGSEVGDDVS